MLNRRLVRIKVFQALFANYSSDSINITASIANVKKSILELESHFFAVIHFVIAMGDYIRIEQDPRNFKYAVSENDMLEFSLLAENKVLDLLSKNEKLAKYLAKPHIEWVKEKDLVFLIYKKMKESATYTELVNSKSQDRDIRFVDFVFEYLIRESVEFEQLIEEKTMVWYDEKIPIHKALVKLIELYQSSSSIILPELSMNIKDDLDFVEEIINSYYVNKELIAQTINKNTPKWDEDRLTQIDFILLAMGLTEFRYCPFVPVKVTINEYIEIAKMYSTPKSAKFINGTLDKILKTWQEEDLIFKKGRGLLG